MAATRILVLKQEGLRQFVEAEPAFAAIRAANPKATIDLLTTPTFGRLAKGAPYFDRVLAAGQFEGKAAQKEFVSQIRKMHYSDVYDLDGSRMSLELKTALKGFRGPRWVGPKKVMVKTSKPGGSGLTAPALRKLLHDANLPLEPRLPSLEWAFAARKEAANMQPSWFGISGPFALFLPAAAPEKRWPAFHYARVAQALAQEGLKSVLIGDESLSPFALDVAQQASHAGQDAASGMVVDLTGKADLAQVAMLAKHAHFFIAGASEELHLCVSVGCSGIVLLHPSAEAEAESLFGRDVIKMVAQDMSKLSPEMTLMMLRNMGLLQASQGALKADQAYHIA
ncbi:MAG: glycosyltransferase family 9 protein [Pseudomonadota bacterium]